MSYRHFTIEEREVIALWLAEGVNPTQIAKEVRLKITPQEKVRIDIAEIEIFSESTASPANSGRSRVKR